MIVDAFTFYNELDMLECKLEYLYDHVDYFVISECNYTHSGQPKPLYYQRNENRFHRFKNKIIHAPLLLNEQQFATYGFDKVTSLEEKTAVCWKLENDQRNNIVSGLAGIPDDALIIIGDLDEIVNVDKLNEIRYAMTHPDTNFDYMAIVQDMYMYNLKYFMDQNPWWAPYVAKKKILETHSPQWLRENARYNRAIQKAGWHLSYFFDPKSIKNKLENFAHQEYNTDHYKNESLISQKISEGKDLLGRDISIVQVPSSSFPKSFINAFRQYYPIEDSESLFDFYVKNLHRYLDTDKNMGHCYISHVYDKYLSPKKYTAKKILEIGMFLGDSQRMWNEFFPNATIYGTDVNFMGRIIKFENNIIKIFGDAYSDAVIDALPNDFDIIIDDGPHTLESMITFLKRYSFKVRSGGVVVIEDIQSIDWIPKLMEAVPAHLVDKTKVLDLRHVNMRYDDIVLLIEV